MRLDTIVLNVTAPALWLQSGATFRGDDSVPENSCQFMGARYMDSLSSPHIVGVGKWWWLDSLACGQCIAIRAGNLTVMGVIGDYCPGCTPRQLDLNKRLSAKLSPRGKPQNFQTLSVGLADCRYVPAQPLTLHLHRDSNPWVMYVQVLFATQPAVAIRFGAVDAWRDKYGRWVVEMHELVWRSRGYAVRVVTADGRVHAFTVAVVRKAIGLLSLEKDAWM